MKVSELMAKNIRTCVPHETLNEVAKKMWDGDCGCVPVVDADGKPIAMVTDRDVCMAAFLTGEPLHRIPAKSAASQYVQTVRDDDSLEAALSLMHKFQVRRLPVVAAEGGRLVGVLSTADILRHTEQANDQAARSRLTWSLSGISKPWSRSMAIQLLPRAEA